MASAYATKVAEGFSAKLLQEIYEYAPIEAIVNRDYEGEINQVGSTLNILSIDKVREKTYTGANLTVDDLYEKNAKLNIDQWRSFYWREKTIDKWKSYIKKPKGTVLEQTASERRENMMKYLFGFYDDVAAGNRIGTDYTTGTVEVAATTGVVTGTGTTFTAAMVGKPFKAAGHSAWYRVKQRNSNTEIVIEDDSDDLTSAYTGGAISAGATYTIQAATPVTLTKSNVLEYVTKLKTRLTRAGVPAGDRNLFVSPEVEDLILGAEGVALNVPEVYRDLVQRGMITYLRGFKVFSSSLLSGDETNGYHMLATHRNWLTFADKPLEVGMEEDLIGNFGSAYKDLFVYGGKVADARRKFAAELYAKV